MKKIDLGQAITILANVGVIAGIVFLAVELNQNSELLAMQARSTLTAVKIAEQTNFVGNVGGIAEIFTKARKGEPLNDVERGQLRTAMNLSLFSYAAIYKEVTNGLLTESDVPIRQWAAGLGQSPMREYWDVAKDDYDPEFIRFVEDRVFAYELEPYE